MLRRDTEYVLTWNALDHSWLARPIEREGEHILHIGRGGTPVDASTWSGDRPALEWSE